jgi:hypothetical protein
MTARVPLKTAIMERGWRIIGIVAMLLPLVVCGCSKKRAGAESYEPGTHKRELDLRVLGFHRSYLIHVPKNY